MDFIESQLAQGFYKLVKFFASCLSWFWSHFLPDATLAMFDVISVEKHFRPYWQWICYFLPIYSLIDTGMILVNLVLTVELVLIAWDFLKQLLNGVTNLF